MESNSTINNKDDHSTNIEFIYENPTPDIHESQINAFVQLFNGLLKKSA